jgi:hypothetical protein
MRRRAGADVLGWLVAAVLGLAVLSFIGVAILAKCIEPTPEEPIPFDSAQWKAARDWDYRKGDNVRRRMVPSLRASHLLEGKTREEVAALLGPPEGADGELRDDSRVPPEVAPAAAQWDYEIGYAVMDYGFLAVHFDRLGRVQFIQEWQG